MKIKNLFIVLLLTAISFLSCKKEPGIGGDASIQGKVFVKHYNTDFTNFISSYYGPDIYVYLIFGNDISYSKRIKTTYDGGFEFKFLYEGDYKVYVYSIDSLATVTGQYKPDSAVVQKISISGRTEDADAGTFTIFQ